MSDETKELPDGMGDTVTLTKDQFERMVQYASDFNMTIQGGFLELMQKMDTIEMEDPRGAIIKGNYAPLAIGAALAAIVERYDESCEEEFWQLVMSKYADAREKFKGILEEDNIEKEGVTTVEMQPTVFDTSKLKH